MSVCVSVRERKMLIQNQLLGLRSLHLLWFPRIKLGSGCVSSAFTHWADSPAPVWSFETSFHFVPQASLELMTVLMLALSSVYVIGMSHYVLLLFCLDSKMQTEPLALGTQKQADPWVQDHPSLHSKFLPTQLITWGLLNSHIVHSTSEHSTSVAFCPSTRNSVTESSKHHKLIL